MTRISAPAWAVHFHADDGHSAACYDARCGIPPLGTTEKPRFTAGPPSRPLMATRRSLRRPVSRRAGLATA